MKKIRQLGSEFFHVDGWTDRRVEAYVSFWAILRMRSKYVLQWRLF